MLWKVGRLTYFRTPALTAANSCIASHVNVSCVNSLSGHALVLQWSRTGRPRHILQMSVAGRDQTDELRMVGFVPPTSARWRECMAFERAYDNDGPLMALRRQTVPALACSRHHNATAGPTKAGALGRYGFKLAMWDRDSGSSRYDSLESSFLWGNFCAAGWGDSPRTRASKRGAPS